MQVVDRQLKPCYLLETCPRLQSLYLDWQFELSEPPFRRYTADWLSEMVRQREWAALAQKLTRLEVVFPAAHTPNAYRYVIYLYLYLIYPSVTSEGTFCLINVNI